MWLAEHLTRASDGVPQMVMVGGEAGVGKTRLVDELGGLARRRKVRVLVGGCVPLGGEGVPFAPVTAALRGLVGELDAAEVAVVAGPAREELRRLLPDVAWGGEPTADGGPSGAAPGRLFELLMGVVERLAGTAPLVLILEDLHWADRSTRDLVAYLAGYLRSGRVMVVLTFRSDELDRLHPLRRLLGELGRNRRVRRVELARLSRAEVAEHLAGLLGGEPPVRLVDHIYARSEGNPFFTEELMLAGGDGDPDTLPPGLREVLLTRLVRLGERTQRLLRVAAAAGPGVTEQVLTAVGSFDEEEVLDGLREAVDHQLLVPQPGGDGYAFRHALMAEAVYGELLPGERVSLHTALARGLDVGLDVGLARSLDVGLDASVEAADPPATRAARLAYHWSAAGDRPRALSASIQAAAAAEQIYAFPEAQLQLERALDLWDHVPDAEQRAGMDRPAVLSRCADVSYAGGDPARAAQLVGQALARVDEEQQPLRAGLLHEKLARCRRMLGDPGALAEQQQAVQLVPPEPSVERARVLGTLAHLLILVDRFEEATAPAKEAITIAEHVGTTGEEAAARMALGGALVNLGEPDAGLAEMEAARRLASKIGEPLLELTAMNNHADMLLTVGRLEDAATVALDGIQRARRTGMHRFLPVGSLAGIATEALVPLGRWDEAEGVSGQGLENAPMEVASIPLLLARAALEIGRGDFDAAEAHLQAVQNLYPGPIPEAQKAGPLFTGLAEIALWRGNLNQAARLVAEAIPLVEANPRYAAPLFTLGLRIEADRANLARAPHAGQPVPDDTATTLLRLLDHATAGPAAATIPELAAWQTTAIAEQTRQTDRTEPRAWESAVAAWERLGHPYRVAYAQFRQAEALMTGPGHNDTTTKTAAATMLGHAADLTDRVRARPLHTEIAALTRRARLAPIPPANADAQVRRAPTPAEKLGLTPRETEVLALVAAGHSNRQIAHALFVSPKTVSVHVSNILSKLGVATRIEAAAIAHRLGLD
jgi:DNA-binding CsgD family transcriptional regulator/tetratricopeptide (TPR) repeat protein